MINTIFNYNDALTICNKSFKQLSDTNIKKPKIYDEHNNISIQINELNNPIWKITETSIKNTIHYIYHIVCNQCYLFTIINGKKTFYKLLPDKLSNQYITAIKNAKSEVNNNDMLTDYQKNFIHKMIPNRIMQCIVKRVDFKRETNDNEYLQLFQKLTIPDGMFILNLTDALIMRNDNLHPVGLIQNFSNDKKITKENEYLPILSLSRQKSYIDIPIPNYDELEHVYKKDNPYKDLVTKWEDKTISKAIFRGSATGCGYTTKTNMRLKLYELSLLDEYKDILDAGIVGNKEIIDSNSVRVDPIYGLGMLNTNIKTTAKVFMPEQSLYKYIIHIDGNVNAYRLLFTMATGSLILRVKSQYLSWAEEYLLENVHYVSIKPDLSNLKEVIEWCLKNDHKCKIIANNARKLATTILTSSFIENYFYKVFWKFELKKETDIITFKSYHEYKQKRKTIEPMLLNPKDAIEPSECKVAIIIPHRNRLEHLKTFIQHFNRFHLKHQLDIYIINQHNNIKFNRGFLLNIGFYIASHYKYNRYIFHDVDSYPDKTLFELYFKDLDKIIHFQNLEHAKYKFPEFFGGVEGFNATSFEKINGFPNNFFGWGGEDDALYNRLVLNNMLFYRPSHGKYILPDHPQSTEINNDKHKLILNDLNEWKQNGINQLHKLNIFASTMPLDDFIDRYNEKKLIEQYKLNYIIKQFKPKKDSMLNYYCFHIDFYIDDHNNILEIEKNNECNMNEVKNTAIYKTFPDKKNLLCNYDRIIRNFKDYILNEINIDYTYIWDIVIHYFNKNDITENKYNFIIFEMPNNDDSNYVDLICPPNKYDEHDTNYFLILKRGNIYNPIIGDVQTPTNKNLYVNFNKNNSELNYNLYRFLNLVPNIFSKCNTENKHPSYVNNITATDLINILSTLENYKVKGLIINNYLDIIGVFIDHKSESFQVYTTPISISQFVKIDNTTYTYYMNTNYIQELTYHNTKYLLEKLYHDSKKEIPCHPMKKVLDENNQIIGIITIANTFINVIPDIIIDDEIPIHRDLNYNIIDNQLLEYTNINEDHQQYTRYIEIETKLYNLFRLFVKNHLSNSIKERQELLQIYQSEDDYQKKLNDIYSFLIKHYHDKIIFKEINNINDIQTLNHCIYDCMSTKCKKRLCDLIIPLYNLVTGVKNETIYFSRLSDEILRYKLIHNFILKNNTFLPFYDTKYKIDKTEILITRNLLDQYFDKLEPLNPYENVSYHKVNSNLEKIHRNINMNDYISNQDCFYIKKIIDIRKLSFDYPLVKERIYINSSICSIQFIIDIISNFTSQEYDYKSIKQLLLKLYKKFPPENILSMIYKDGKPISSLTSILDDKYYFTPFDFKMLSSHFQLPIINITSKEKYIEDIQDIVYCISNTTIHNNIIPSYSIIMNNENIQLHINDIKINSNYTNINDMIIKTKIYQHIK